MLPKVIANGILIKTFQFVQQLALLEFSIPGVSGGID